MAKVIAFFGVPKGSQSDSAVPTCVARGPDGALYVGELLGGFYSPGHARIWRVVPGHAPKVWATGLSTVQGCGFGRDGAFYATEFQTGGLDEGPTANPAGDVVRIDRHGHRTHLGVGKLFFPSGFAAGSRRFHLRLELQHRPGRRAEPAAVQERRPGSQDQLSTGVPRGSLAQVEDLAGGREGHRAAEGPRCRGQAPRRVDVRGQVGEDQPSGPGPGRVLAGLPSAQVQVRR